MLSITRIKVYLSNNNVRLLSNRTSSKCLRSPSPAKVPWRNSDASRSRAAAVRHAFGMRKAHPFFVILFRPFVTIMVSLSLPFSHS
jgi:hypothetical protein